MINREIFFAFVERKTVNFYRIWKVSSELERNRLESFCQLQEIIGGHFQLSVSIFIVNYLHQSFYTWPTDSLQVCYPGMQILFDDVKDQK